MSATVTPQPAETPSTQALPARMPAWMREPLLHFVVLGGLLFGADHLLISRADDPHTIVLSAAADAANRELFKASRGHEPSPDEVAGMRRVWLDNEVLYREGLALQVDRGDNAIRDRVIFKALNIVDAGTKLPALDEAVLRQWFEAHRIQYDEPARYDFQEATLSGEATEAAVRAFVVELNAGKSGDAKAGLRLFKGRPHGNLVVSYGEDFAKALAASPIGEWRAQHTRDGWRAIQLEALTPGKPADFVTVRNAVQQDWTDATLAEQRSAAVKALAGKYKVIYEADAK